MIKKLIIALSALLAIATYAQTETDSPSRLGAKYIEVEGAIIDVNDDDLSVYSAASTINMPVLAKTAFKLDAQLNYSYSRWEKYSSDHWSEVLVAFVAHKSYGRFTPFISAGVQRYFHPGHACYNAQGTAGLEYTLSPKWVIGAKGSYIDYLQYQEGYEWRSSIYTYYRLTPRVDVGGSISYWEYGHYRWGVSTAYRF